MNGIENVVLIKINRSYKDGMSPEDLYNVTSHSWVASFERTDTRDIQYYISVYKNKIIEVYSFTGYEEEIPERKPPRYILNGRLASEEIRQKLIGLDVSSIHKGSGNPIKYTNLETLLKIDRETTRHTEIVEIRDIASHIHTYITSKGFIYSEANIKNLYLSLRSKPFVIISGISGTGKTKIVQLFAEAIGATEENKQLKLVPVRPDWSDSSDLIGYTDLTGKFREGPLTEMVKQAHNNPDLPYFVLLDEMNLARVEYYFSDVLSVMESRREDDNGEIISSPLTIIDDKPLTLPNNLYVLGTVNMDETTHPFSKKVLDRANTIEFNEIHLDTFSFETIEVESKVISNSQIQSTYLYLKHAYRGNEELVKNVTEKIVEFNKLLQPINAHVGYRVRDEICFYMIYNNQMQFLDEDQAFDFCIMQKILPRIAGSGQRVQQLLEDLFEKLAGQKFDQDTDIPQSAAYLLSAKKVAEMLRRLADDGFTSFWIS